ncbi:MAG: alpha/beta hydrolase [Eggerthellaceae bacterium]|nr:alpha/beta hydrolase [Eggerthellaceae bacterium]
MGAKNLCMRVGEKTVDVVRFGSGEKVLVMLPGLGDGLHTAKGVALPTALQYRALGRGRTVYMISRPRELAEAETTRDMAAEVAATLRELGVARADVMGVSMGGMIAQWLAADYPNLVGKLVLCVTVPACNDLITENVTRWLDMADAGNHQALMTDTAERMYTGSNLKKMRLAYPLLGLVGKPKTYDRFRIQANACLTHDASEALCAIQCPTLVIGGEDDATVGPEGSQALAAAIPGAELKTFPGFGHGLYEEVPGFCELVASWLEA